MNVQKIPSLLAGLLFLPAVLGAEGRPLDFGRGGSDVAGRCPVPGVHATIQGAVADPACRVVVLEPLVYRETLTIDRPMRLEGDIAGGTHLEGLLVIDGHDTEVSLSDLNVHSSCDVAIETLGGARVTTASVDVRLSSSSTCQGAGPESMMARLGLDFVVVDSDDARDPRVGVDAQGRSHFVFTDTDSDTIHWIAVDELEAPVAAPVLLSTTVSSQEAADIAVRSDGSFYATWRSDEGVGRQIRSRYHDGVDGLDASDALVNDLPDPTTFNGLEAGGVAALGGGGFAVTWSSRQTHGVPDPSDKDDVQGQVIGSDGVVATSNQFPVNNLINSGRQTEADVAPTLDGGFLAVWESYMVSGYEIRGRRYAADGTPMGDEFRIETDTTGGQHDPRVAANEAGELLVVWEHGTTPRVIRGRLFDADVAPVGDDFLISSRTDVTQQFPDVAGGAEHFVVGWARREGDWDVLGRVVTGQGAFDGPAFQVNSYDPPNLGHNEVGVGAHGYRAVITWQGKLAEDGGIHSIGARTVHLCGLFCDGFESGDSSAWSVP